jgi:hypothetical protein
LALSDTLSDDDVKDLISSLRESVDEESELEFISACEKFISAQKKTSTSLCDDTCPAQSFSQPYVTEDAGGNKFWSNEKGEYHREDGPAIERANGTKYWYLNGQLHREDGPAIEYANGHKEWYLNGKLHRKDGPAVEYVNGDKRWYFNGQRHRVDGPAIEWADGDKEWWLNGERHRVDGPAFEAANGYKEWWLNGEELSEGEFKLK